MLSGGDHGISVAVVDNDKDRRAALQLLLERARFSFRFLPSLESLATRRTRADCVLMAYPGATNTPEIVETLARHGVHSPLLYLTRSAQPSEVTTAIKAGVFDFLQWPEDKARVVARIRSAINANLERDRTRSRLASIRERIRVLSQRERQVMRLVAQGNANKVVSYDLGISKRTVEVHRGNVMRKLCAQSLAQLVLMDLVDRYGSQPSIWYREDCPEALRFLLDEIAADEDTADSRRVA